MTLPNFRWLMLQSQSSGRDWVKLSFRIDEMMSELKYDLAEEIVAIMYEFGGSCWIARPVIGSLKDVPLPFVVKDWKTQRAWISSVEINDWDQIPLIRSQMTKELLSSKTVVNSGYFLFLKRNLRPELSWEASVILKEK